MPRASTLDMRGLLFNASIDRKVIERLTIVGQREDSERVTAWLADQGFRFVQSGPYTDREMFPAVDVSRFRFTVERVLEVGKPKRSKRSTG